MSVECQVHVNSQSKLDIGGRETSIASMDHFDLSMVVTLCLTCGIIENFWNWGETFDVANSVR